MEVLENINFLFWGLEGGSGENDWISHSFLKVVSRQHIAETETFQMQRTPPLPHKAHKKLPRRQQNFLTAQLLHTHLPIWKLSCTSYPPLVLAELAFV